MSSKSMDTEIGGEQTQYEGVNTHVQPHKKSGGQFGRPFTTVDPANTDEAAAQRSERGQQTAENIRYGQASSEQGMGGFTTGQSGQANQGGYGRVSGQTEEQAEGGAQDRRAAGYGDEEDMNCEVGA